MPESELTARAPVTLDRVIGCYNSAEYWARALPHYADRQQRWADIFSIFAGVVTAATGLAIWPVLTGVTADKVIAVTPGTVLYSVVVLAAAISALLPRIFSFGEMAGHARELASQYGSLVGDLRDLKGQADFDPDAARAVVEAFDKAKAKKDALRRLPNREKEEATWAVDRTKRAQAEAVAAEAELKAATAQNALAKERHEDRADRVI